VKTAGLDELRHQSRSSTFKITKASGKKKQKLFDKLKQHIQIKERRQQQHLQDNGGVGPDQQTGQIPPPPPLGLV
jgi:hypothetical protein